MKKYIVNLFVNPILKIKKLALSGGYFFMLRSNYDVWLELIRQRENAMKTI